MFDPDVSETSDLVCISSGYINMAASKKVNLMNPLWPKRLDNHPLFG